LSFLLIRTIVYFEVGRIRNAWNTEINISLAGHVQLPAFTVWVYSLTFSTCAELDCYEWLLLRTK